MTLELAMRLEPRAIFVVATTAAGTEAALGAAARLGSWRLAPVTVIVPQIVADPAALEQPVPAWPVAHAAHLARRHLRHVDVRGVASRSVRDAVTGLLHGDTSQFLVQLGGATLCAVYAFGFTYIVFKIVNAVYPMRVSREVELEGLDVPQFGMEAYPDSLEELSA